MVGTVHRASVLLTKDRDQCQGGFLRDWCAQGMRAELVLRVSGSG